MSFGVAVLTLTASCGTQKAKFKSITIAFIRSYVLREVGGVCHFISNHKHLF
jgi:hypothetical protein